MSAIILTTACFLLSILPPTCIQYLAFRQILQEPQRTRVRRSYLVIFLIEIVLFMAIFQFGWLEFRFLSYKKLLMAYWIPYVLSFSLISRPYAYQNLFVAGMQGIYTTTIHALSMNLVLLFIPRSAFFTYLPIHLVLYTALRSLFPTAAGLLRPHLPEIPLAPIAGLLEILRLATHPAEHVLRFLIPRRRTAGP